MPIYLYKCPACGTRNSLFKPLRYLERTEPCETCETTMERQICAPAVVTDYAGYSCPVSGKWIEGRRAHDENLKRHGCRVLESGETAQASRDRSQTESALDRQVENTVEQFWEALPSDGREQLASAVTSGLDVTFDRK